MSMLALQPFLRLKPALSLDVAGGGERAQFATIFEAAVDPNSGGWQGYTLRQVLGISVLTMPDFAPSHARWTIQAGPTGLLINDAYFGRQFGDNPYDYDPAYNAAMSFPALGPNAIGDSGWVALPIDRASGLVAALFTNTAAADYMKVTDLAGAQSYYKNASDAGTPDAAGYTIDANAVTGVIKVEVAYFPGSATFP